jgi:hypothetical protein
MDKLVKEQIVPDVLDELPIHELSVKFGIASSGESVDVNFGKELTIKSVTSPPTEVLCPVVDPEKFYTLCLCGKITTVYDNMLVNMSR